MTARPLPASVRPDVALVALPDLDELARRWRALEARSDASFFVSWDWIGTWLALLSEEGRLGACRLLVARQGGQDAGLAVVTDGPVRRRFGLPFCRTAWLHATGDPACDILTIEHNDLLVARDEADALRGAMLAAWLDTRRGAFEMTLPGLAGAGWAPGIESGARRRVDRHDWVRRSYGVDLAAVRAAEEGDFLRLLSGNTRSQIRRSLKEYARLGPLTVTAAASVEEGLAWLDRLAELHQAHWTARGQPGAFSNPFFTRFHRRLVSQHLPGGSVQILRVRVGEQDLGLLYSFIRGGRVYFYQSGLAYDLIEKHARPGLVAHALAVQRHAADGHAVYDFMAGDSRYKVNLATLDESMTWTTLRSRAWRFRLEEEIRRRRAAGRPAAEGAGDDAAGAAD